MPKLKLTKQNILAVEGPDKRYMDTEIPGLCLRVRGNERVFYFYRRHKTMGLMQSRLGSVSEIDLAQARELARTLLSKVANGQEPVIAPPPPPADTPKDPVMGAMLVDRYLKEYAQAKKSSWKDDKLSLEKHFLPRFGSRDVETIQRPEVRQMLREVTRSGAPVAANRLHSYVSKMFKWAVAEEIVETNPTIGLAKLNEEKRKQRVLSDDEIRLAWRAFDTRYIATRCAQQMMMVTAQRRNEVCKMRWDELDLVENIWTIPGRKTKNGRAQTVPLTPLALFIIEEIRSHSGGSPWVFLSNRMKMGDSTLRHIGPNSVTLALSQMRASGDLPMEADFTIHDYRRTIATHIGKLTESREAIMRVLNHTDSEVTAVYDLHTYDNMKRKALTLWDKRLQSILGLTIVA